MIMSADVSLNIKYPCCLYSWMVVGGNESCWKTSCELILYSHITGTRVTDKHFLGVITQ